MNNLHKQKVISEIHNSTYFSKRHLLALINLYRPKSSMTWDYPKLIQHTWVVEGSFGSYWAKNGWKMAPETCTLFLWFFSQYTCKCRTRFETLYVKKKIQPTWSEMRRFSGSPAQRSKWMRPKSIPLPTVSIRSHIKTMRTFTATSNWISWTVNITFSRSSSVDSESDMTGAMKCQTKSDAKT